MECWQSGNAPDSKSGEPIFSARRFKSCTLLCMYTISATDIDVTLFFCKFYVRKILWSIISIAIKN